MDSESRTFTENLVSMIVDGFGRGHPGVRQDEPRMYDNGCFITLYENDDFIFSYANDCVGKEYWSVKVIVYPVVGKDRAKVYVNLIGTPVLRRFEISYDQSLKPSDYAVRRVVGVVDMMFILAHDMKSMLDSWCDINDVIDDTTDEL